MGGKRGTRKKSIRRFLLLQMLLVLYLLLFVQFCEFCGQFLAQRFALGVGQRKAALIKITVLVGLATQKLAGRQSF